MNVKRIDPPCWFTGLGTDELKILVYGYDLENASVETNIPNDEIIVSTETGNSYLLLSLKLKDNIQKEIYEITLKKGYEGIKIPYEFKERRKWETCKATITNKDMVYLLMPDRFACANDVVNKSVDRKNPNVWHSGNIKGMIQALDYLQELGLLLYGILLYSKTVSIMGIPSPIIMV